MAIAVDSSTPIRWSNTVANGASITSASFTAPTDALLVACVCLDGDNVGTQFGTDTLTDSGGLTWTERVRRAVAETDVGGASVIYTARTASSVSRTVNLARSGGTAATNIRASVKVYVLTGVDVDGTPLDTVGANNEGGSTTTVISTTSITPGANGLHVVVDTNWAATDLSSTNLTEDAVTYGGQISALAGYQTCSSGVGITANLTAVTSAQHKWAQIIVREAAGGGGLTLTPAQGTLSMAGSAPIIGKAILMPDEL